MGVVTVLDFNSGEVHIYEYKENKKGQIVHKPIDEMTEYYEDIEELIDRKHRRSDCEWMCTDRLNLTTH